MNAAARILVIEDEPSIRDHLVRMLEFEGFDVAIASDGREGVRMARDLVPDVVICDLLIPGINGFGACRVLRDDPVTSKIPTIVISALNSPSDREKIRELGVARYLSKPFRNQDLIDALARCMEPGRNRSAVDELVDGGR